MKVRDIIFGLNKLAPFEDAYEWDNVGLLVGDRDSKVERIYVSLDATDEAIEQAIKYKANLLVTHHPLIFGGIKHVVNDDLVGRRVQKMIKHDISCVAAHTNFDVHVMGNLVADKISISSKGRSILDEMYNDGKKSVGIGVIGEINETTIKAYADVIKERLRLPCVSIFGDTSKKIKRVAVVPGSGKSEIDNAIKMGADVLVTGDIDHHSGIDAVAMGLGIIDAGHFGLEHVFVQYMQLWLHEQYEDIEVMGQEIGFPTSII